MHWWERRFRDLPDTLIRWQDVERIETEANRVKLNVPYQRLAKLHPADLADIIEDLNNRDRTAVMQALDMDVAADALQEIEPEVQSAILEHLSGERASDLLETMPADEAADILGELPDAKAEELLNLMEAGQANEVRELLEYEEGTAGRLMTTEFIAFTQNQTVDETIVRLREAKPESDVAYYLYVVDEQGVLRGVVSLRDLVVSPPGTHLGEVMHPRVIAVRDTDDQAVVAEVITKYDLLAVPVVDENRHPRRIGRDQRPGGRGLPREDPAEDLQTVLGSRLLEKAEKNSPLPSLSRRLSSGQGLTSYAMYVRVKGAACCAPTQERKAVDGQSIGPL